jgi:hypothetical protein
MRVSDYIGALAFGAFGLWWLLHPASVLRFYAWFHRGRVRLPPPAGIRVAGLLWIVVVVAVTLASAR